jgi:hypothetical protein
MSVNTDPVHVATGGEGPTGAGEHHRPGVGVGGELAPHLGQPVMEAGVGSVELLRPVEAHDAHRTALFHRDLFR